MKKLLITMISMFVVANSHSAAITCYVGTPQQFTLTGDVVLASDEIYRVQGEDFAIFYLPTNQCVVQGIVRTPIYRTITND